MKSNEANTRQVEILYEIYKNKVMTIDQVQAFYFNSFFRARNYLLNLEKKGLIKRMYAVTDIKKGRPEQIFLMDMAGIELLRSKGFKNGAGTPIHKYLVRPNEAEIRHDLTLVDIIIYLYTNELIEEYTTELFIHQIRYSEKKNYRIPDLIFKDKDGYGFIELEKRSRAGSKLFEDFRDYRSQYKDFKKIFVVREERVRFYIETLSKTSMIKYEVHTFTDKKLQKKYP